MNKDSHPLDDFFRESLKDLRVTPSAGARSRFLKDATTMGGKGGFRFWRWFNIIAVTMVITASVILYFALQRSSTAPKTQTVTPVSINTLQATTSGIPEKSAIIAPQTVSSSNQDLKSTVQKTDIQKAQPYTAPANSNIAPNRTLAASIINSAEHTLSDTQSKNNVHEEKPEIVARQKNNVESQNVTENPEPKQPSGNRLIPPTAETSPTASVATVLPETINTKSNSIYSTGAKQGNSPEPKPIQKNRTSNPTMKVSPFLKYSFDWAYDNKVGKAINSLGIEGKMQYGRFLVTLGGEFMATSGNNRFQVLYNDYLGNYKKLDSITFSWDENHYHLVPQYYTTDNTVWDSAVKTDYYQVLKKYRLMRIPVMFGYEVIRKDRFQAGIKAGVAMVFCLDKRQVSGDYSAGQNKLIGLSQDYENYGGNNYYLLTDLYASYFITRRIVLDIEPHFDYLLNPDENWKKVANNLSIPGIRISLKYKF